MPRTYRAGRAPVSIAGEARLTLLWGRPGDRLGASGQPSPATVVCKHAVGALHALQCAHRMLEPSSDAGAHTCLGREGARHRKHAPTLPPDLLLCISLASVEQQPGYEAARCRGQPHPVLAEGAVHPCGATGHVGTRAQRISECTALQPNPTRRHSASLWRHHRPGQCGGTTQYCAALRCRWPGRYGDASLCSDAARTCMLR
jgi:hypothetical protein